MALKIQRVVGDSGSNEGALLRTQYNNLLDGLDALGAAVAVATDVTGIKAAMAAFIVTMEANCVKLVSTPRAPAYPHEPQAVR